MKLGATITSERGKAVVKTGNEYITITFTSERRQKFDVIFRGDDKITIMSYYTGTDTIKVLDYIEDFRENGNLKHGKVKECGTHAKGTCPIDCMYRNY